MAYNQQKIEELRHLISISGNCVNLGRSLLAHKPDLHSYCMESTKFLNSYGKVKFNERVYCIVNNVTARPHNYTGVPSNFSNLFQGYIVISAPKPKPPKEPTPQEKYAAGVADRTKVYFDRLGIAFDLNRAKRIDWHVRHWLSGHGKQLYNDNMVEGTDYFVCPITGIRKSEFREAYYTKLLGLTREQFCEMSGLSDLTAPGRKQRVSAGVNAIDPETGKRKCEIGQERARETLSAVDPETGLTGYQKKGQKTRATHMANVDEYNRNGFKQAADARNTTIAPNGSTVQANALKKRTATMIERYGTDRVTGASNKSKLALAPILDFLNDSQIEYWFDTKEYRVVDPATNDKYFCDLAIRSLGVVIEYQSITYHPDPRLTETEWLNWKTPWPEQNYTAEVKLLYDYRKARIVYEQTGMRTWFVWEKTSASDVEDILCMLKTMVGTKS
jgi:hypothetical protein